ncbi:class I SAM-dependent methyltransferase [Paraconexibacter antarcticus]|uniref:class I SAM-dependent methyltransferase n=1 Tax=Paraconexibacter antarcticus TaxID=2949664 RepID=UPI002666DAC3|nr:class I SAM-dependent methyltransferase [Paraconexibacter antarcticus]
MTRGHVLPWLVAHAPLEGRTVLEYGCGQGAVTCALAPHAGRYLGFDIDPMEVEAARRHVASRGLAHVDLTCDSAADLEDRIGALTEPVDVFLLYAVLEHMTVGERLAVLRLARRIVAPTGHIVVVESPNRLTPIDHHTGRLPFLHSVPDELALDLYKRSPRPEFVAAIDRAGEVGGEPARRMALARWGRGVSFHEFEVVFGDLAAHTVASSFDGNLYPIRPVRGEELQLAATLEAWRPDLAPSWSRTWIDVILSAAPSQLVTHVRPWALRLPHDVSGAAVLADGRVELRPGAWLPVELPAPTAELHVGLMAEEPADALRVRVRGEVSAPVARDNRDGVPPWHAVHYLHSPASRIDLSLAAGGCLTYVGYRGAPDPEAPMRRPMGW